MAKESLKATMKYASKATPQPLIPLQRLDQLDGPSIHHQLRDVKPHHLLLPGRHNLTAVITL